MSTPSCSRSLNFRLYSQICCLAKIKFSLIKNYNKLYRLQESQRFTNNLEIENWRNKSHAKISELTVFKIGVQGGILLVDMFF